MLLCIGLNILKDNIEMKKPCTLNYDEIYSRFCPIWAPRLVA